jgi:MFS transporter, PPP family, 3-phenylpropionic acid transporter
VNTAGTPASASAAVRMTIVMSCLFATAGVNMVFLPRWLEFERDLAGAEIGAVLSLAQAARIVTGPAIALWADGAADRRTPLRIVAFASVGAYLAFFFLARDFGSLLIVGFIALSLTQAMTPLMEAAALRATAQGKMPYGIARSISSASFIVATIAGGALIARFGLGAVVAWVLTALMATALASWFALKPDPAPARVCDGGSAGQAGIMALLRNPRFLTLIMACGLIQSGHAFYYGFSTLIWQGQGIADDVVGLLWGFGVAVEVVFLWNLASIERRVSPEALILAGAGAGVLRWLAMGFAPTGLALWPLQALHALSFAAAHVGAMRLLYRETPEAAQVMGQTLYAALSGGILMGAAMLVSGALYDFIGAGGYWAMALLAGAGGGLALRLLSGETAARVRR